MKKTEIKYVGWCHECKCLGSFICGNCKPNEKYSFARPSEFMPKDKKTLGKNGGIKNEILRLLLFMH